MDRPGMDTAVHAVFDNADVALQLLQHLSARDVARVSTLRTNDAVSMDGTLAPQNWMHATQQGSSNAGCRLVLRTLPCCTGAASTCADCRFSGSQILRSQLYVG